MLRTLILGGTVFLGRHLAAEALARGHDLTIFTRGVHGSIEGAEHLIGDRTRDLSALEGREWDVVIDTSGAELDWIPDERLQAAGIEPWTELPLWLPAAEFPGTWEAGTERAQATGLRRRPIAETVADVWAWLRALHCAA